jgi:drug/metabolite transporter (DMT)-like permease
MFISLVVNVLTLGVAMLVISVPAWSASGVAAYVLAGLLGSWLGRVANFKAIRRIGAARSSAFLVAQPLAAALGGWLLLGESVQLVDGMSAILIVAGLGIIIRSRMVAESLVAEQGHGRGWLARLGTQTRAGGPVARAIAWMTRAEGGFFYALAAPLFFGLSLVAGKWGLLRLASPATGAFLGTLSALAIVIVSSSFRGKLRSLVSGTIHNPSWWFVGAGIALSSALLLQFAAFFRSPAWVVSVVLGTQALWVLLFSLLFIRREEKVGSDLIAAIALVVTGVSIIGAH